MKRVILISIFLLFSIAGFSQNSWQQPLPEKESIQKEFKIYPNPCKSNKVTLSFETKEISEIRLTNITGKQVLLKKYQLPAHRIQLQLYDIPNGIYLVQAKTSDNKMVVKKLMVSRN